MKTRAQRVTFRAILVAFTLVSLFFACMWGFQCKKTQLAMFLVIFVPGLVAGSNRCGAGGLGDESLF